MITDDERAGLVVAALFAALVADIDSVPYPPLKSLGAAEATRTCTQCGKTKPTDEFHFNHKPAKGRPRFYSECKQCANAKHAARIAAKGERPPAPPLPTREEMAAWYRDGCRIA